MKKSMLFAFIFLSGYIMNSSAQVKPSISTKVQAKQGDENSLSEKVNMLVKEVTDLKNKNTSLQDELNKLKIAVDANYKVLDYGLGTFKKTSEKNLQSQSADFDQKLNNLTNNLGDFKKVYEGHYHSMNNSVKGTGFIGTKALGTAQPVNVITGKKATEEDNKTSTPK